MLEDYLAQYEIAINSGDKKAMQRIEQELMIVGMDKATLAVLMKGRMNDKKMEGK